MPPDYFTAVEAPRCPSDGKVQCSIGVFADLAYKFHVGTAVPAGDTESEPREIIWWLVIRGQAHDQAYRVRDQRFEPVGDAVEWKRRPGVSLALKTARITWITSRRF